VLGFNAEIDLDEGLTRLVEWWQAAGDSRPKTAALASSESSS
jgi:hypothetical protein